MRKGGECEVDQSNGEKIKYSLGELVVHTHTHTHTHMRERERERGHHVFRIRMGTAEGWGRQLHTHLGITYIFKSYASTREKYLKGKKYEKRKIASFFVFILS